MNHFEPGLLTETKCGSIVDNEIIIDLNLLTNKTLTCGQRVSRYLSVYKKTQSK